MHIEIFKMNIYKGDQRVLPKYITLVNINNMHVAQALP